MEDTPSPTADTDTFFQEHASMTFKVTHARRSARERRRDLTGACQGPHRGVSGASQGRVRGLTGACQGPQHTELRGQVYVSGASTH